MTSYMPEGWLIDTLENQMALSSVANLNEAMKLGTTLEARAILCDKEHNLHIDLISMQGIIPRNEGAIGIEEGFIRDIALISRVNKPVTFKIMRFEKNEFGTVAILSRRAVQVEAMKEYVSTLKCGDVIDARVTHMEKFGAFVDIASGIPALIPVDAISVSRIPHPSERFFTGEDIRAIVKSIDENGRITLTHKELLGTWEQNVQDFSVGETVPGIIRSIENYGIFVELTPNLAGLAEYSPDVHQGQHAGVYIKSLIPEKMKIKLIIVDAFDAKYPPEPMTYFTNCEHIDSWIYSPENCEKLIQTVFSE
ncbi:MAG: S1 RNA-binding domain-containing protein [Clostridiales bacterium]|nr:S1 RNA-binding domain-containing protein [Clostridiales bacterium]